MTFQESIRTCFSKYADFTGVAARSEYWWFVLFLVLLSAVATRLSWAASTIISIATLLPLLAAGTRRLRDTGRSGWWQLFILVPVAGIIVLAIFMAEPGKAKAAQA